ncbi:hypothetical protein ABL78_5598 [Leptomonas seymouri]|uniref:Uncharacterized protein n=1 Tax=Leptomonas seymouri TaxID=5684 RepID=A0A0N1I4K8_LEPSE|nr:hypothetical protein ABL78_5598 [Leptomonas seymouri]|eukprot:KPI85343.1 hypothetical protein ABL78_5598 [Leptomonas seymouri]
MLPSLRKRYTGATWRAASASPSCCTPQRTSSAASAWTLALTTTAAQLSSLSFPFAAVTAENAKQSDAWTHFAHASRQLRKAVRARSTPHTAKAPPPPEEAAKAGVAVASPSASNDLVPEEGEADDAVLEALAPSIVRRTSTAAASVALMRELGVMERAEYRAAAAITAPHPRDAIPHHRALPVPPDEWTPYLTRVCQTGIRAQVASCVIVKHLSSAFQAPAPRGGGTEAAPELPNTSAAAPTLQWSADLPPSVRLQLLSHELSRVERQRRFIGDGLRGEHLHFPLTEATGTAGASADARGAGATVKSRALLSKAWVRSALEARAIIRCCAAPWLLGDQNHHHTHSNGSGSTDISNSRTHPLRTPTATAALLTASERGVLVLCLRLAAQCHAEDIALELMEVFTRSVDAVVRRSSELSSLNRLREEELERAVEAFESWYEAEGADVYQAAMICVAQQRSHATPSSPPHGDLLMEARYGEGFARAYSFLVHWGTAIAHVSSRRDGDIAALQGSDGAPTARTSSPGSVWTTSLIQYPVITMRLLRPLAGCVDANAEHYHVVKQLYLRLLEETELAYSAEGGGAAVRQALAALLMALARVPLGAASKSTSLEDIYRRTLMRSPLEVVQHPSVVAGCLHACSAANMASRSVSLFNKLAEPSSRSLALQEESIGAVCLAQSNVSASSVLQRHFSFMQMRLPVTADVVHAGVASALRFIAGDGNTSTATTMTSAFAMLDLLTSDVAQNRVTRGTAAMNAERTFFFRVLLLIVGISEQPGGLHGGATPSLCTPAAAAVFQQWVDCVALFLEPSAAERGRGSCADGGVAKVAQSLSLATVELLQMLCLVLQRADRLAYSTSSGNEGRAAADTTAAASLSQEPLPQQSPLVKAVRRLLEAVPPPVEASAWSETLFSSFSRSLLAPATPELLTLPPAFQWRQLRERWPLAEQQRFMEAFAKLFAVTACGPQTNSSGSRAAVCMRYRDYMLLEDFYQNMRVAVEWGDEERVWGGHAASNAKEAPASLQGLIAAGLAGSTATARPLYVLSPLADIEWWLQYGAGVASAEPSQSVRTFSLPELLKIPVPPVVGCPDFPWAAVASRAAPQAETKPPTTVSLSIYSLKRWVDSVEDAVLRPSHSLFRQAVTAFMDRDALSAVPLQDEEGTDADDGGERAEEGKGGAAQVGAKRDGIEEMLVRGPTSLIYDTVQ